MTRGIPNDRAAGGSRARRSAVALHLAIVVALCACRGSSTDSFLDQQPALRASAHAPENPARRAIVTGRVFNEHAVPLARARLYVGSSAPVDAALAPIVRCDDNGRFATDLRTHSGSAERWWIVASRGSKQQGTTVDAPAAIEGRIELGDVVLESPSIAIRGRVVDPRGAPVDGVRVELARLSREHDRPADPFRVGVRTRDDGRFELRSPPGDWRWQLSATKRGMARDVRLVDGGDVGDWALTPLGWVTGRVVLPESPALARAMVELRRTDTATPAVSLRLDRDGSFAAREVPVGAYQVGLVADDWVGPPLVLWSSIEICASDRDSPFDVGVADARGRVVTTLIDVRSGDGRAPERVSVHSGEPANGRRYARASALPFVAHHAASEVDAVVDASGAIEAAVRLRGEPIAVTLELARRVELRFHDLPPSLRRTLLIEFARQGGPRRLAASSSGEERPCREIHLDIDQPGTWWVRVLDPSSVNAAPPIGPPAFTPFEVADSPELQVFDVPLPPHLAEKD